MSLIIRVFHATALALAFCLAGCDRTVQRAQDRIAHDALDPSSVQFREVRRGDGAVCGERNAKNAFGAYTGFARFVVTDSGATYVDSERWQIWPARWRLLCQPDSVRTTRERDSLGRRVVELDSMRAIAEQIIGK